MKTSVTFDHDEFTGNTAILLKVMLDKSMADSVQAGEFAGIGSRVAQEIADKLYPEIEKRLLEDPQSRELILAGVVSKLTRSLALRMDESFATKEK